jgi:hypothetical protein
MQVPVQATTSTVSREMLRRIRVRPGEPRGCLERAAVNFALGLRVCPRPALGGSRVL